MKIMGIDPGLSGAIAVLGEHDQGVCDIPVFEITKNGKVRRQVDVGHLLNIIEGSGAEYVFIERVGVMPGEGTVGAFKFGWTCGVIEALVVASKKPFSYVTPMVWKKALQCPKDKDGARMRASQLLPQMISYWPLKKHDGRAEAALIALWGRQQIEAGKPVKKDVDDSVDVV